MSELKEFVIKIECDGDIDVRVMENLINNMLTAYMLENEVNECSYNVKQIK